VLGNRTNLVEAQAKGAAAMRERAAAFARNVLPVVREIQQAGSRDMRGIAVALNARGVRSAQRAVAVGGKLMGSLHQPAALRPPLDRRCRGPAHIPKISCPHRTFVFGVCNPQRWETLRWPI
jgi:hypothetical protein